MQLIFDQLNSTVWLFATPTELLKIAAIAQQRLLEARPGESLAIFEENINRSDLVFRISVDQYSDSKGSEIPAS